MTFREKLKEEYPDNVSDRYRGGCQGCPKSYGYEPDYACIEKHDSLFLPSKEECRNCWDREMPEDAVAME